MNPPPENQAARWADHAGKSRKDCRNTTTSAAETQAREIVSPATMAALRDALPKYAATLGDLRQTGATRWRMSCPLPEHADARPSFAIFASRRGGYLAKCSCQWHGDALKLCQALNPGMPFREAVSHVAAACGIEVEMVRDTPEARKARTVARAERKPELPPIPDLPADFEQRHRAARARLYGSPELLQRVADMLGRNITPELVQSFTYTSDALGWESGCLLYLYEHGCKVRMPEGSEDRFRWKVGRSALPWRWHFAARDNVREVYLTTSESDAVALVAAGLEVLHPKRGKPASAVIAIPGAGNFAGGWAPLFQRKRVTLVFDWDGKDEAEQRKTGAMLAKHAARVATLDLAAIR